VPRSYAAPVGPTEQRTGRRRRWLPVRPPSRAGVRLRATAAAVLVVAVALGLAAVALVTLVGAAVQDTVTTAVRTRAEQVAADLTGSAPQLQLAGVDDGVLVQVVSGDRVLAASPGLRGRPPLTDTPLRSGQVDRSSIDGARVGEAGESYRVVALGLPSSAGAERVIAAQSLAIAESTVGSVTRLSAVGVPLLLVVVGAATWFSVGRALQPVEAIRARTARIGAADLSARVPVPSTGDEVAALAGTMNGMLARLEASARAQRAFVSDAGHEMRSPVAVIRTEMEVAERVGVSATTVSDVLSETGRLERLVEDLLVLARADEGQIRLHRGDVDVDDLLEAERRRLRNDVVVTAAITPARVQGDRAALERVVRNLVDNAVRHAAGRVHLASRVVAGNVEIEVVDDGPGVPAGERERVFERFVRLDEARARQDGGSGLGLAIVRELVRAHAGQVELTGDGPLPGARCVVRLPVDGAGGPAQPPLPAST
jgi:signal transduction histidine kinase